METYKIEKYITMDNPNPGRPYRFDILTPAQKAKSLGGMMGLLIPRSQVPYHYHRNRESIILVISGEGIEISEGKDVVIEAGDLVYIPAGEKHATVNNSDRDLRYLEFYNFPPLTSDFVMVRSEHG